MVASAAAAMGTPAIARRCDRAFALLPGDGWHGATALGSGSLVRARRPVRLPVVLSRDGVRTVLGRWEGVRVGPGRRSSCSRHPVVFGCPDLRCFFVATAPAPY